MKWIKIKTYEAGKLGGVGRGKAGRDEGGAGRGEARTGYGWRAQVKRVGSGTRRTGCRAHGVTWRVARHEKRWGEEQKRRAAPCAAGCGRAASGGVGGNGAARRNARRRKTTRENAGRRMTLQDGARFGPRGV